MGIFPNYNKPGPGVPKDAPSKPRFFVFFEVFGRKFWHLIRTNFLFVLFNIPAYIVAYFMAAVYLQKINIDGGFGDLYIRLFIAAIFMMIPMITVGPVQAGYTYILRNFSREEHAFLWWDFKETAKKNFKQGMIVTIIDILVIYVLGIALNFYSATGNIVSSIATAFVFITLLIFSMMHLYLYPMMITVNLGIKDLYKNAFIFSILKLIPNLLMIIVNVVLIFASFYNVVIGVILFLLITPTFIGLMNNFYANPIIKKYVIDKYNKEHGIEEDANDLERIESGDDDEDEPFIRPLSEEELEYSQREDSQMQDTNLEGTQLENSEIEDLDENSRK